jgi:hypothetical protein
MEIKQLTSQQKKGVAIAAGVLMFIHFLPSIATSVRQLFVTRPSPPPMQVHVPAPPPVRPVVSVSPPDPMAAELTGRFAGKQLEPNMENCQVSLEVKPQIAQTGFYSAYESRSCVPSNIFYRGPQTALKAGQLPNLIEEASPVSSSMSGSIVGQSMNFRIDQVVGMTAHHCGPRSYSISPFGTGQVMAQWEEPAPCNKSGHMVLVRARS